MEVISTNANLVREFWYDRREVTEVSLLSGGMSLEDRQRSAGTPADRVSQFSIEAAMERLRLWYRLVDPGSPDFIARLAETHVAFVNLHGEYGEDGRLQGMLDWLAMPYTHSGVRASAVAQHKPTAKQFATGLGIRTPEWTTVPGSSFDPGLLPCELPVVCKPASGGSSIALTLVDSISSLEAGIATGRAADPDGEVLVERFVDGRHVTVAIVELLNAVVALPTLDVVSSEGLYGEKTKLGTDTNIVIDYACPARVASTVGRRLQEQSMQLFQELGCRGVARVDWMVDASDETYFLEVNVVPGLSASSNVACAAEVVGLGYDELVATIAALPLHDATTAYKPTVVWSSAST